MTFAGATLLASAAAFAQMQPGGGGGAPGGQPTPGQPTPGTQPGGMSPTMGDTANLQTTNDKGFVRDALQGGMAEVQLGHLAAQKGSAEDVKQFGQKMVDDHTKLGDQMSEIAQQLGVKPPDGPSKKDKKLQAKLENLSGPDFDKAYIEAMIKDHKEDVSNFTMEAQHSQNPAVKQAASQAEPVLESHLKMIQQIAEAHNLPGGKSK
ncbi:MAG TPA: DUF4142 domain-containing protein [Acidobacteriaceae bacterium]|nr:DUF4142 domain-containing protein [Acidobacteriaceae bacterium]